MTSLPGSCCTLTFIILFCQTLNKLLRITIAITLCTHWLSKSFGIILLRVIKFSTSKLTWTAWVSWFKMTKARHFATFALTDICHWCQTWLLADFFLFVFFPLTGSLWRYNASILPFPYHLGLSCVSSGGGIKIILCASCWPHPVAQYFIHLTINTLREVVCSLHLHFKQTVTVEFTISEKQNTIYFSIQSQLNCLHLIEFELKVKNTLSHRAIQFRSPPQCLGGL